MTDLAANEIVMNNGVLPHSSSRENSIHLEVTTLEKYDTAEPNSEYIVKFVVPDDARGRVADVQYVLDLGADSPAKFTTAPSNGGIGCEDKRSHGKSGKDDTGAIITINDDAANGATLEINAGWATGHESVTLVEKVVLIVGQGVARHVVIAGSRRLAGDVNDDQLDDALADDEAEAELEEAFLEQEREELEGEIEEAEEDAIEALEEKRQETDGSWNEINQAEEEIVEALEDSRRHVDTALNSLKEEIIINQSQKQKGKMEKHKHNMKERMQAQLKHREHMERRHVENRLDEMHNRFKKDHALVQQDKLDKLREMRGALKDNVDKLHGVDKKEHAKARREHIKPLSKPELKVDLEELRKKAKEKMHLLSKNLGVNELMNEPHMKKIRAKLKEGNIRGGEAQYHGDVGEPLPPEGRHFLLVMFGLFGLVGLVRWGLDKRRKAAIKERRSL